MMKLNPNKYQGQKCVFCGEDTGDITTQVCPKCEKIIYESKEDMPQIVRSEFNYD